ncbi:MAG: DUF692 family protein [Polyangiaceae bacterium]|jgi:D-arabinose 1-dehydrogenase-like Zn-dependent alcohol dehydrogenase/uncharacterized protein (UPF0276 family)|nr:DUF692 family protein [Polyangiaceae bacterium]MBK8940416.1 DUF692 family protein [Polyangiaceae bacterium]
MGLAARGVRQGVSHPSGAPPRVGLSLMPADDWWAANEPLFFRGLIDAVEWSVDFGWGPDGVPEWLASLLERYGSQDRLYAHGVELSAMSAIWTPEQDAWLAELEATCARSRFRHLTEHYGFITAADFVRGTPLPLPPSAAALGLAERRLQTLRERAGVPVGIENLAFALSRRDVEAQASFVSQLLERTDAFLLLDVHNLYCQAHNFGIDPLVLARSYPLHRAREIHVSGGSWSTPTSDPERRRFRRDSHDDRTPNEVFSLLSSVLELCPALEVVILERTDRSLFGRDEAERHREDFVRLRSLVHRRGQRGQAEPPSGSRLPRVELARDDEVALEAFQGALVTTLASQADPHEVKAALQAAAPLAPYREHLDSYEPRALEIGAALVKQWGARAEPEDSMRAVVFRGPGSPLELRSLPRVAPGPGQVLVRVVAVGLCGTDAHAYRGSFPVPTPIVLGHEIAGVVEALGSGVTDLEVGDRVGVSWVQAGCGACAACDRGAFQRCASPRTWIENGGGLSELTVAEASGCTRLPDGLDPELAAPLFCAGHVAFSGLRKAAVRGAERVAVVGLGGLGHLALQIASALGHETLAVSSSLDKLEDAREGFGADHVVRVDDGDVGGALERAGGADIVLATTSNMSDVARSVRGLRLGGRVVLMGLGEGLLSIDPIELVQREASVIGSVQGSRAELEELLTLAAEGKVRPRVEVFPLLMAQRALARLLEGRVRYRAVVRVG